MCYITGIYCILKFTIFLFFRLLKNLLECITYQQNRRHLCIVHINILERSVWEPPNTKEVTNKKAKPKRVPITKGREQNTQVGSWESGFVSCKMKE